jgi:hypothetical protein
MTFSIDIENNITALASKAESPAKTDVGIAQNRQLSQNGCLSTFIPILRLLVQYQDLRIGLHRAPLDKEARWHTSHDCRVRTPSGMP